MPHGTDEPAREYDRTEHRPRPEQSFPDYTRSDRQHAGESIQDTRNWPGILLFAVSIVTVGLTLTAAGYGFEGWAIIAGVVATVCLCFGVFLIAAEHRRVKTYEGRALSDPGGH
ncbi:hypothetical protein AB0B25_20415 [Nocardia sp. NPDC049190]|uniref:hypothetical protein n=1 Tax=Nocardia sp. NPDC049190 TaxID=3155650 RepID=UPI0033DC1AFA